MPVVVMMVVVFVVLIIISRSSDSRHALQRRIVESRRQEHWIANHGASRSKVLLPHRWFKQ